MDSKAVDESVRADDSKSLDIESISSAALARLIEEVRNDSVGQLAAPTAYNRTYHRHNR
jgi:hypothetical protein